MRYIITEPPPKIFGTLKEAVDDVRKPWETAELYNQLTKLKPGQMFTDSRSQLTVTCLL